VGTRCLRPGLLALGQNQRCRRALERAGPDAPARVVVAHRQHRSGDRQVQPYRPRIARSGSGDGSGATVGIIRMAALTLDFCYLTVSRIARTARQRDEQIACLPGPLVGPHHPQPVYGRGHMFLEFSGQAGPGAGTGFEVRYQAISSAHGDLFSHMANPRVNP